MNVKVLGSGCANCAATVALIEQVAKAKGIDVSIEKVEDLPTIMRYGVLATPGVVIDGTVVHAGGRPTQAKIEQLLGG
jgi:small redox-active disulfide protein 2